MKVDSRADVGAVFHVYKDKDGKVVTVPAEETPEDSDAELSEQ